MNTFDNAFYTTIGHEGGYVNDPNDNGGETKFGVSKRAYPHLNIKNLTMEDAQAIYLKDYWMPCLCSRLPPRTAFAVFDLAVNAGVTAAKKDLQVALGLVSDGVFGFKTLEAIDGLNPGLDDLRISVRVNAAGLIRRTDAPTWANHGKGWARRVARNLLAL